MTRQKAHDINNEITRVLKWTLVTITPIWREGYIKSLSKSRHEVCHDVSQPWNNTAAHTAFSPRVPHGSQTPWLVVQLSLWRSAHLCRSLAEQANTVTSELQTSAAVCCCRLQLQTQRLWGCTATQHCESKGIYSTGVRPGCSRSAPVLHAQTNRTI